MSYPPLLWTNDLPCVILPWCTKSQSPNYSTSYQYRHTQQALPSGIQGDIEHPVHMHHHSFSTSGRAHAPCPDHPIAMGSSDVVPIGTENGGRVAKFVDKGRIVNRQGVPVVSRRVAMRWLWRRTISICEKRCGDNFGFHTAGGCAGGIRGGFGSA